MYRHFRDYDDHVLVTTRHDAASGLCALIAIHNDTRGPAIGGCRILKYASPDQAMTDLLRLSRGMTYKNAIAGIPYGGGKAVIIADPKTEKTEALLHALGDFVQSLQGRYITSFDSGTTLDDLHVIGQRTAFVGGTLAEAGNASASTAKGIYHCMRTAAEITGGEASLRGVTIAIQGLGNVGERLAMRLAEDGARLIVADIDPVKAQDVALATGAAIVGVDEIVEVDCDILSPCALGGVLSLAAIATIRARAVVGGANNQLLTPDVDDALRAAGILYCPDYLANAGGIINLHHQRAGWSEAAVDAHVASLGGTFREVASRASDQGRGTAAVADAIARERFGRPESIPA